MPDDVFVEGEPLKPFNPDDVFDPKNIVSNINRGKLMFVGGMREGDKPTDEELLSEGYYLVSPGVWRKNYGSHYGTMK